MMIAAVTAAGLATLTVVLAARPATRLRFATARQLQVVLGPSPCAALDLVEGRNNASFWVASPAGGWKPELVIRPANSTYEGCPGLSVAAFSVVAHYGNESHVLPSGEQDRFGVYRYDKFPSVLSSSSEVAAAPTTFEVRLDFGFYPGGDSGQPCLDKVCMIQDVARTGVVFSGDEILTVEGTRPQLGLWHRPAAPLSDSTPLCRQLDPLPVAFYAEDKTFAFADDAGARCAVRSVGADLPSPRQLRWIQVLGDSNSRYLLVRLAERLNLTLAAEHTAPTEKHPTTLVYHDGSGSGLVLAFQWFFIRQDPSDVKNLAAIDLSSLGAYLASIPFADPPAWPKSYTASRVPVTDLFVGFGSHAPALTQTGMRAGLERLHEGLAARAALARSLSFLLAPATEPSTIPESYGPQSAMRNNLIIEHAQNAVVREFAAVRFPDARVVDFFSMTRVLPVSAKKDSVHFLPEIYSAQADLLWTAMYLGDEADEAASRQIDPARSGTGV